VRECSLVPCTEEIKVVAINIMGTSYCRGGVSSRRVEYLFCNLYIYSYYIIIKIYILRLLLNYHFSFIYLYFILYNKKILKIIAYKL